MIALQRPPRNVADRFNPNLLAESDRKGNELFGRSQASEIGWAIPRFLVTLVLWLIPCLIVYGVFWVVLFVIGNLPGIGRVLDPLLIWAARAVGLFMALVWLGVPIFFTVRNLYNASSARTKEVSDDRLPWVLGARETSRREDELIDRALLPFGDIPVHRKIWILDLPTFQSMTIGDDLYISSKAVDSSWLTPILLHEIGHLKNQDGRMIAALRAYVAKFALYRMTSVSSLERGMAGKVSEDTVAYVQALWSQVLIWIYGLIFGGISLIGLGSEWSQYFKERDFLADEYVVSLGLGQQLKEYLKETPQKTIAIPFSANWVQANELRIDRILWLMGD